MESQAEPERRQGDVVAATGRRAGATAERQRDERPDPRADQAHHLDAELALAVGLSLCAACSTASVVAMALPWLFDAFDVDPAFGSGPLATVVQDLLSIWIYFLVATAVIR